MKYRQGTRLYLQCTGNKLGVLSTGKVPGYICNALATSRGYEVQARYQVIFAMH